MVRFLHRFSKAEDMYLPYKLRDKWILSSLMKYAHLTQMNVVCRENAAKSKFLGEETATCHLYLFTTKPPSSFM